MSSDYPFITPSSSCLSEDLLFFDTFSHSNSDKDNFDLVQFPSPVIIDLIKIVPLGQPVEANIPGNVRLGATNPSECELEFFINDLTKEDAHTMTDLGKFYCNEKNTDYTPPIQVQTDGLLLRGSYRTLTLAIFGQIVCIDEKPEDEQAMISAASPPAQTPASPVASERDLPYIVRDVNPEILQQSREEDVFTEESLVRGNQLQDGDSVSDNINEIIEDGALDSIDTETTKNRVNLEDLSNSGDGTAPASFSYRDKKGEELEYSNSDDLDENDRRRSSKYDETTKQTNESIGSSREFHRQSIDDLSSDHDSHEWSFNVETYSPKPLIYFPDPSLTLQERTLAAKQASSNQQGFADSVNKEVAKVKEMFEVLGCSNQTKTEDWVTLVEDLTNDIANMSLSQTVSNGEMLQFLVEQVMSGLDMSLALQQKQTGFKVRHLKAGLKLATILFHCGSTAANVLLNAGVLHKVLLLYNQERMSLTLRLLIFRCLNTACDTNEGIRHVIKQEYSWPDVSSLIKNLSQSSYNKEDIADTTGIDSLEQDQSFTCYQYMIILLLNQHVTRITIAIGNLIKKIRLYQNFSEIKMLTPITTDSSDTDDSFLEGDRDEDIEEKIRLERCLLLIQDTVYLIKDGCSNIAQPVRYLPAKVQFHIKPSPIDSYMAIYKWIKHFRIIECLNFLISSSRIDALEIEQSIKLRSACLALIQQILDSPRGAHLLLSTQCCEQTANLLRNLGKRVDLSRRISHIGIENLLDASLCREESLSIATCRDMSLKLAYCFKVLSCIDKLFGFHRELLNKRSSDSKSICDPEKVLHQLFIISDHPYGLTAIMKHFSCIGNLDCILRFLDMMDYQKHLEFVRETSIDYVLELVGTFFRLNNNVLEIAEEYLETLVDLCKIKEERGTLSTRIKSLLPWLTPFDLNQPFPLITYSEETFRQLTRVIRKSIPDKSIPFAQGLNFELPPQLITAVRILRQLCISPQVESFIESNFDIFSSQRLFLASEAKASTSLPFVDSLPRQQNPNQSWNLNFQGSQNYIAASDTFDDSLMDRLGQLNNLSKLYQPYDESICGDLKYHYGIMQLYEQEGLKRLLNTLRELIGNYSRPIYQSAALCGLRGRIVISYIHSVIILLHSITCHLIDAKGKEFKDTSIISVVLETYSLLCFVPKPEYDKLSELSKREELSTLQKSITLKYDNYQLAQQAKKLILSILLSYTQICLSVSESEENVISKSMWTKMLKEVVDFTLSTPIFFQHGLDVLTRIMPTPLPCPSLLDTMDQEQLFKNINHRKLWSAHLHPLHQKIELMISNLSLCYQRQIRTLLFYLCNQLCDLSSNAACMVAKTVTDTLISCAAKLTIDTSADVASVEQGSTGNQRYSEDRIMSNCHIVINGTKESKFAIRMILDLLCNLITNQAFETAFTNHLQVISKRDEKLLTNLSNIIKYQDDYKQGDIIPSDTNTNTNNTNTVANLVESIRLIANASNSKDNLSTNPTTVVTPPDELTKINLIEMARKTSDRFNLATGITKTYRLKVLLDINSHAHRSSDNTSTSKRFETNRHSSHPEPFVAPSHKPYVPPLRGRSRPQARPDSFRSRPQNTSRPPSIHVDDFIDLYGDNSSSNRYRLGRKPDEYRGLPAIRYQELAHGGRVGSPLSGPSHGRYSLLNQQALPPPNMIHQSNYAGSGGGSHRSHNNSKYMKSK